MNEEAKEYEEAKTLSDFDINDKQNKSEIDSSFIFPLEQNKIKINENLTLSEKK